LSTAPNSRQETGVVLVARASEDLSHERATAVRQAMDSLASDGWWFLNPGTFIAVFLASGDGPERAAKAQARLHRFVSASDEMRDVAIGTAEGRLLCTFDNAGILQSLPLGHTVNVALTEALRNAG